MWIMFWLVLYNGGDPMIGSQEFNSKQACYSAINNFNEQLAKTGKHLSFRPLTWCVPK